MSHSGSSDSSKLRLFDKERYESDVAMDKKLLRKSVDLGQDSVKSKVENLFRFPLKPSQSALIPDKKNSMIERVSEFWMEYGYIIYSEMNVVFLFKHEEECICVKSKTGNFYRILHEKIIHSTKDKLFQFLASESSTLSSIQSEYLFLFFLEALLKYSEKYPFSKHLHFSIDFIPMNIDESVSEEGLTPLHIAINEQNVDVIRKLIAMNAVDFYKTDPRGWNAFHFAASSNKEIIQVLLEAFDNSWHYYALLLCKRTNDGYTPLCLSIKNNLYEVASLLISHRVDAVFVNNNNNETCLEIAIKNANVKMVKMLLVFGAEHKNCETAIDISSQEATKVGNPDLIEIWESIKMANNLKLVIATNPDPKKIDSLVDFIQNLTIEEYRKKKNDNSKNMVNLLSFDGGGVRVAIMLQLLIILEERMKHKKDLISHFHWIAGTGTGAIIAAALCAGRPLRYCQEMVFRMLKFFNSNREVDIAGLRHILQKTIGSSTKLQDIDKNKHKLILTAVDCSSFPLKQKIFRNFQLPLLESESNQHAHELTDLTMPIWEAASNSSTAPDLEKLLQYKGKYIDGGLIANDPTIDLFNDVQTYNTMLRAQGNIDQIIDIGFVLSIGADRITYDHSSKKASEYVKPQLIVDTDLPYLVHLYKELLVENYSNTDESVVSKTRTMFHNLNAPFFRFSKFPSSVDPRSETIYTDLIEILWDTIDFLNQYYQNDLDVINSLL